MLHSTEYEKAVIGQKKKILQKEKEGKLFYKHLQVFFKIFILSSRKIHKIFCYMSGF